MASAPPDDPRDLKKEDFKGPAKKQAPRKARPQEQRAMGESAEDIDLSALKEKVERSRQRQTASTKREREREREPEPEPKPEPKPDPVVTEFRLTFRKGIQFSPEDYDLILLPYHDKGIIADFAKLPMLQGEDIQSAAEVATQNFSTRYAVLHEQRLLLVKTATSARWLPAAVRSAVFESGLAFSSPIRIADFLDYSRPGELPLNEHIISAAEELADTTVSVEYDMFVTMSTKPDPAEEIEAMLQDRLMAAGFGSYRVVTDDTPNKPTSADMRTHFLADHATDEDLLGYHPYAMGIASFVKDRDTALPLTIAIDGAWGKGKSSLMKMLRNELDPNRPTSDAIQPRKSWLEGVGIPFRLFWIWLRSFFALKADIPAETDERRFATVFINAWRHGKGSQLKARIVDEILTTMTARFGPAFLLRLQMKRLDRMGLLETATKALFTSSLVLLPILFFSILLLGALWLSPEASVLPESWVSFFDQQKEASSLGVVLMNVFLFAWKQKPSLKLDDYLRAPDYTKLAGDDAEVEDDFRRILEALEERGCSLALFIDDLDRCAPKECADVVEVLNTFFGSEGRECLFILGMHREMVASALDVAYKDLVEKINANDLLFEQRPFGRRFLEKIVQFVVALPEPDDDATEEFLDALTAGKKRGKLEDIKALQQAQERELSERQGGAKETIARLQKYVRPILPGLSGAAFDLTTDIILARLEQQNVDVEQAKEDAREMGELKDRIEQRKNANENEYVMAFKDVRDVIRANPRQYKRFFNKLRFYRLLNVAEDNPMFVDACEAVLALEHPELHYRTVKTSGSFSAFALASNKAGARPAPIRDLLAEMDEKPGLKELREKLAKEAKAAA